MMKIHKENHNLVPRESTQKVPIQAVLIRLAQSMSWFSNMVNYLRSVQSMFQFETEPEHSFNFPTSKNSKLIFHIKVSG